MPGKKYPLHWEQIFLSAQTRYNTIRTSFTKSRYFYTKQAINVKGFLFKAAFLTLLVTAPPSLPSHASNKSENLSTSTLQLYENARPVAYASQACTAGTNKALLLHGNLPL